MLHSKKTTDLEVSLEVRITECLIECAVVSLKQKFVEGGASADRGLTRGRGWNLPCLTRELALQLRARLPVICSPEYAGSLYRPTLKNYYVEFKT